MGLGDRHCENIMIDAACGDCVHIDFGIMFDKVRRAACPEGSLLQSSKLVPSTGVKRESASGERVLYPAWLGVPGIPNAAGVPHWSQPCTCCTESGVYPAHHQPSKPGS